MSQPRASAGPSKPVFMMGSNLVLRPTASRQQKNRLLWFAASGLQASALGPFPRRPPSIAR
jgi:hypothetical protein